MELFSFVYTLTDNAFLNHNTHMVLQVFNNFSFERYISQEPSSCSRGCDIYDEIELVPASEENNTQGGVSLIPLQVTTAEGQPYHYNISVPGYNSSAAYYLVLLDLGTNQTAFRKIVSNYITVTIAYLCVGHYMSLLIAGLAQNEIVQPSWLASVIMVGGSGSWRELYKVLNRGMVAFSVHSFNIISKGGST